MKFRHILRLLAAVTIISTACATAQAKKEPIRIDKVWLEHNCLGNGEQNLTVHTQYATFGLKDIICEMRFYMKEADGAYHKMLNCPTDERGNSYVFGYFRPGFEPGFYENTYLYIPNKDIDGGNGTKLFNVQLVWLRDGKEIAKSADIPFYYIGDTGDGPRTQDNDHLECMVCHGTGRCAICNGSGHGSTKVMGSYPPCFSCGGNKICNACKGRGWETAREREISLGAARYNQQHGGEDAGWEENLRYPDHQKYNDDRGNFDKRKYQKDVQKNCKVCHGTGVNPYPNRGAAGSRIAYLHNSGKKCPYCGQRYEHHHDKCSSCVP